MPALTSCLTCHTDLAKCRACNGSSCRTEACWRARTCGCASPGGCICESGAACPRCSPEIAGPVKGWSILTSRVPMRAWKTEVRGVLDKMLARRLFSAPEINSRGDKVNREAWLDGWHGGLEESHSTADGSVIFRALFESEDRGVAVRLPSSWVDEIRQAICPEAPGRSE